MVEKFLRNYEQNEIICVQGTAVDRFFILRRGKVGIRVDPDVDNPPSYDILSSGTVVAEIDEPGAILGEAGLFLGSRTASIVAHDPQCVIEHVMVGPQGIARLIVMNPSMGVTLCRSLAMRLRAISAGIRHLFTTINQVATLQKRMAVAYVRIVNQLKKNLSLNESTLLLLNECQNGSLYRQGFLLQHEDNETQAFIKKEIAQRRAGEVHLDPGAVLCHYGEVGRCMYLLLEGTLEVRIGAETVATVEAGEFAGEMAVLLKEAPFRTAELRAVTGSRVAVIGIEGFLSTVQTHPQILLRIGRQLAKRIRLSNRLACEGDLSDPHLLDSAIAEYMRLKDLVDMNRDAAPRAIAAEVRELLVQARELRLPDASAVDADSVEGLSW